MKPSIFISYAHEDEPEAAVGDAVKWLSFVTHYLEPAVTQGLADVWVDNLMSGGEDWDAEIKSKLCACDVFILLVSVNSLKSKYILEKEIAAIKDRQKKGEEVRCYPLLLTTTPNYALGPVRDWNIRPKNLTPFEDYPPGERKKRMSEAADEIIGIAEQLASRRSQSPDPASPPRAPSGRSPSAS